ncbi:hypothetical protein ACOSQ3_009112 [Xanthoceras sorbifolium]
MDSSSTSTVADLPSPALTKKQREVQSQLISKNLNYNLPIKLDQTNFIYWKTQILPVVRAFDMEEFIFGPTKCPDKFVQITDSTSGEITLNYNDEYLNWKKIDQLLVSWLFSTLSPSVLGQVTRCVTACEVWSLLVQLYSRHSMARIMHIRSQLQNLKKGALSITEFAVKVKGIVDSLTAAGQIISIIDLVAYILGGLGQDFDPVIATITAKKEDNTLQEAQFLLMSFDARLEQFTSHVTLDLPPTSANVLYRIHKGELLENFLREN